MPLSSAYSPYLFFIPSCSARARTQAGAGSATLSMAYAGYLFTEGVIKGLKGEEVTMCAYVESSITDAVHAKQSRSAQLTHLHCYVLFHSLSDTPLCCWCTLCACCAALHSL